MAIFAKIKLIGIHMKHKTYILLILAIGFGLSLMSCGSDSEDENSNVKDAAEVELSDIKGKWRITDATETNVKNAELVLNDNGTCTWHDRYGDYAGPEYFLANLNDSTLKAQCSLLYSEHKDRIHINTAKVSKQLGESSDYKDIAKSQLLLTCDLRTELVDKNWADFDKYVNSEAWYFWLDSDFSYTFDIVSFSEQRMVLRLSKSSVRYDSYIKDYPLRLKDGTTLTLTKEN